MYDDAPRRSEKAGLFCILVALPFLQNPVAASAAESTWAELVVTGTGKTAVTALRNALRNAVDIMLTRIMYFIVSAALLFTCPVPAAATFSFEAAPARYQAGYADKSEGVYEDSHGFLFVVVEVNVGKTDKNIIKARAMLRSKNLIQDFAAATFLRDEEKPLPSILKTLFPDSIRLGREISPGLGIPALDLAFPIQVLEDTFYGDTYRYVISLMLDNLRDRVSPALHAEPTTEEIVSALRRLWLVRERDGNLGEFFRAFPLPADRLRAAHERIARQWPGAPWFRLPTKMTARTLAARWEAASAVLREEGPPSPQRLRQALQSAPVSVEIMDFLQNLSEARGDVEESFLWNFWKSGEPPATAHGTGDGDLDEWCNLDAVRRQAKQNPSILRFIENEFSVVHWAWRCAGFADYFGAPEDIPESLSVAEDLYNRGRELDRIIVLACEAAETAPGNAACWSLLGRALLAQERPETASAFLTQSMLLAPSDTENRVFLALAYQRAGFPALARGMAASVLFIGDETSKWSTEKAMSILDKFEPHQE